MSDAGHASRAKPVMPFSVRVDNAGMQASLVRDAHAPAAGLDEQAVLAAIQELGLACGEDVKAAVTGALRQWRSDPASGGEVLLVQARPAVDGQDGQIEWAAGCCPEMPSADTERAVDYYASRLITVGAGATIATIRPPTPGQNGIDIYGRELAARAGKPEALKAGEGCHLDEAAGTIVSDRVGTLHVSRKVITVSEFLEIRGNVDFSTGHIHAPRDLHVTGDVADLFEVTAEGSVAIGGEVNAAKIRATGDLEIRRALTNRRKGVCAAGGDIRVALAVNSIAVARGGIYVGKESVHSDMFSGGPMECGAIRGGLAVATGGLTVKILGSPASVRTLVVAGVDWLLPAQLGPVTSALEELQAQMDKQFPDLKILRANAERLTARQKKMLTEMESLAAEPTAELTRLQGQADELRRLSSERCRAAVTVRGEIYPGIELRLGKAVTVITMRMAGPVTFRPADGGGTFILAEEPSGRPLPLPTRRLRDSLEGITLPDLPPEPRPPA